MLIEPPHDLTAHSPIEHVREGCIRMPTQKLIHFFVVSFDIFPKLGESFFAFGRIFRARKEHRGYHNAIERMPHVPLKTFRLAVYFRKLMRVDHMPHDANLLIVPRDYVFAVDRLIRPADIVAIQIYVEIEYLARIRHGLIRVDIVHIERMLGQNDLTLFELVQPVHERVHQ